MSGRMQTEWEIKKTEKRERKNSSAKEKNFAPRLYFSKYTKNSHLAEVASLMQHAYRITELSILEKTFKDHEVQPSI